MSKNRTKKAKQEKQSWGPVFKLLWMARFPVYLFIVQAVITSAVEWVTRYLPMVEQQIGAGEIQDTAVILQYAMTKVAKLAISIGTGFFSAYMVAYASRLLQGTVWKKIVHLPMSELDKTKPTTLVSRVLTDTDSIMSAVVGLTALPMFLSMGAGAVDVVIKTSPEIARMLLLALPFVVLAFLPAYWSHNAARDQMTGLANFTGYLSERLSALEHIKSFHAEDREAKSGGAVAYDFFRRNMKRSWLKVLATPLQNLIGDAITAIVLIYGGYLMNQGVFGVGEAMGIYLQCNMIYAVAGLIPGMYESLKATQGAAHTVANMMLLPDETLEREKSFAEPDSDIRLENVTFDYGNGVKVLDDLDLTIPTGKVTAIVGPSGSGKTTVLKLLERIYQPTGGTIWFGEDKAESIHLNEWRNAFSIVPQDSPLLFGTIRENIAYGLEGQVGENELNAALRAANVDEIIARMPKGLDTEIGDVGDRLSGGERQRIALARMLIRDPQYLLLDEATSALDAENEYEVTLSLNKLMAGRTTIVVAHNLRTIENADNIVFMENGKVVEQGSHSELLQKSAKYQHYVELQRA